MSDPIRVLLVDDNDDHASLFSRAFSRVSIATALQRVSAGHQALDYLRGQTPYEDRLMPDLVLLDINMPKMTGLQVLHEIRSDVSLRDTVVILMSTSRDASDVSIAYREWANAYVTKPSEFDQICEMMQDLAAFWGKWNVTTRRAP